MQSRANRNMPVCGQWHGAAAGRSLPGRVLAIVPATPVKQCDPAPASAALVPNPVPAWRACYRRARLFKYER